MKYLLKEIECHFDQIMKYLFLRSFLAPPEKNLELALTPLTSVSDTVTTSNHSVGGSELVTQSNSSSCTSPKYREVE